MKRIISLLLIILILPALFACNNTEQQTDTEDTTTMGEPFGTDEVTLDPGTETDPVTETETTADTTADTELLPEILMTYTIYDPALSGTDYKGELTLYKDGKYKAEISSKESSTGFQVVTNYTERGDYEKDETVGEVILAPLYLTLEIGPGLDSDSKKTYLSAVETAYSWGSISKAAYDIIKEAANGAYFTDKADDFKSAQAYKSTLACGGNKAVLDDEEQTAYFLISGIAPSDEEYYIAENGFMLALYDDGTCRMYHDSFKEGGFGPCLINESYEGTYEQNKNTVSCTITKNTVKYAFMSEDSEKEYKDYYKEQYDSGEIGTVYYNYYMSLISEDGHVEDDMSDRYLITVEPHTHTAVIKESPETEM